MKEAKILITGQSSYSQSRPHVEPKLNKESADAYEKRTWAHRLHVDSDRDVVLPAMALKLCLSDAAKFLGHQIPGKGKSTYTKHFLSGVLVLESPKITANGKPIGIDRIDSEGCPLFGDNVFVPADGVAGSGKRVWKTYPVIKAPWQAELNLVIVDDVITEEVLKLHLDNAGLLIGLGRWRVRNGGLYGRFTAEILEFEEA